MENKDEFNSELAKFDPKVAELKAIAKEASTITVTDFTDRTQLAVVKEKRLELRDIRVNITKTGKALRDKANAFNKAVLTKEKEMLACIAPEEERLQSLEAEAEKQLELAKRQQYLPIRREKLAGIGDAVEVTDQELLEMDDIRFMTYFNERVSNWNAEQTRKLEAEKEAERIRKEKEAEEEAKRKAEEAEAKRKEEEAKAKADAEKKAKEEAEAKAKADAEQKKIDDANAEIRAKEQKLEADRKQLEHEKEVERVRKEAEERAKKDAEAKAEAEKQEKIKKEKEEAEAKEAEKQEKIKKEKEEAEAKEAEAKKLKKNEEYKAWLKTNGYTAETSNQYTLLGNESEVKLYKLVSIFKK